MSLDLDRLLGLRLAAQHLTGDPLPSVADAVGRSLGVQSQDMPLARFSLGLRTGLDEAAVLAQLATGEVVRTHVLRPTWHWVLARDLRWLLALTAPRSMSGSASRHAQLGLTDEILDRAFAVLQRELAGNALTRRELQPLLPATGAPPGQVVGHLLFAAESRGLICSGTPRDGGEHTYALVDEVVPPSPPVAREEAIHRLTRRFVAGHGPTAVRDLMRWARLSKREATAALDEGGFETATVDETRVWYAPTDDPAPLAGAWLLPTFDEVFLSHDRPRFPRVEGHPWSGTHLSAAEQGGGVVVVDGRDVGVFKRRLQRGRLAVELHLGSGALASDVAGAERAAGRLGVHLGLEPAVTVHSARP